MMGTRFRIGTKKTLRKLFMYQYNLIDPLNEDGNEETERNFGLKGLFDNIKVGWNLNLKWWMRRRQIDEPCPDDVEIGD